VGVGLLEVVEIYVIFYNVDVFGGLGVGLVLFVFALANFLFVLAGVVVGHLDELSMYLRLGMLDAMLLWPLSVFTQLIMSDVSLRRFGRVVVAVVVFVIVLSLVVDDWMFGVGVMLVLVLFIGVVIFGLFFVAAAGAQFWFVEGSELTNVFIYGSSYVVVYFVSVLYVVVRSFFIFVVLAVFMVYLLMLVIIG